MSEQPARTLRGLADFFDTPLDARLSRHLTRSPIEAALSLFKNVAGSVPAYRAFLDEHGVAPASIRTPADFAHLPLCTKANYVALSPGRALPRCSHRTLRYHRRVLGLDRRSELLAEVFDR